MLSRFFVSTVEVNDVPVPVLGIVNLYSPPAARAIVPSTEDPFPSAPSKASNFKVICSPVGVILFSMYPFSNTSVALDSVEVFEPAVVVSEKEPPAFSFTYPVNLAASNVVLSNLISVPKVSKSSPNALTFNGGLVEENCDIMISSPS